MRRRLQDSFSRACGVAAVVLAVCGIFEGAMQDWFGAPFNWTPAVLFVLSAVLALVSIGTVPKPGPNHFH